MAKKNRLERGVLTDKQEALLNCIKAFIAARGKPPTRGELARKMGHKWPNAVQEMLVRLEQKGWIEITPLESRGIKVL